MAAARFEAQCCIPPSPERPALTTRAGRPGLTSEVGAGDCSPFEVKQNRSNDVVPDAGGLQRPAQISLVSAFRAVAKFFALLRPDRRRGGRLADLRSDRQRLRSRHGRAGPVPAHGAAGVRRGARGRSLPAQSGSCRLPAGRGADGAVPGMGRLYRFADGAQIFVAMAVLGTAGAFESPATAALLPLVAPQGSLQRATAISSGCRPGRDHHRPRAGRARLCRLACVALRHDGAVLPRGHAADGRDPPDAAGCAPGMRQRRPICSPASGSSAAIRRSWARSRSICSRCCSAARPRCCRSTRATSCRPARWGSAFCAPRPRSARC